MVKALVAPAPQPMSELNTTPLIDVLLVLLILLVVTVPPATHSLEVPVPVPSDDPGLPIDAVRNTVSVDPAGTLRWNGKATGERELLALLSASARLKPEPELRFQPDGAAPYDTSLRIMRLIQVAGVTAFGFVGNERFAAFGKPPG